MKTTHGLITAAIACNTALQAQVTINEFQANPSEKVLKWDANGVPSVGSGVNWYELSFNDAVWQSGNQPIGFGVTGLATNLATTMQNKAYSLYLRKNFTATTAQAISTDVIRLTIEYDDGFVAYLNGKEIARKNTGPAKHFVYANQRAYNPTTTSGPVVINIGPGNLYLNDGANNLSIQVHNVDLAGDVKCNASLGTAGAPGLLTGANYSFSGSGGASRTFSIVNGGTPTNSSSGTANNWLTQATDPATTGTWSSLQIIASELANGGVANSGMLRYNVSQLGANGTGASMFAPSTDLNGGWLASAVTSQMLADTIISFRYKTSPGALFGMSFLPAAGQEVSAITGAPLIGVSTAPTVPMYSFNNQLGGYLEQTTTTTGVSNGTGNPNVLSGSRWYSYNLFASSNLASGKWRVSELHTEPSPAGGQNGVMHYQITDIPSKINPTGDEWFGGSISSVRMDFLPRGKVTLADLQRTKIKFRYRTTAGKSFGLRLDPQVPNSYNFRADMGNFSTSGGWQTYEAFIGSLLNANNFVIGLNTGDANPNNENYGGYQSCNFVFATGLTGHAAGDTLEVDDIVFWYETPVPGLQENKRDFAGSGDGVFTHSISSTGVGSSGTSGELDYAYTGFNSPDLSNGQFTITEDSQTVSAVPSTGVGVLKFVYNTVPTFNSGTNGEWWGWSSMNWNFPNWVGGSVSTTTLQNSRFKFKIKGPSGKSIAIRIELDGVGYNERLDFGTFNTNGSWQIQDIQMSTATNQTAFITAINANAARVNNARISFGSAAGISSYSSGDTWFFDDITLSTSTGEPLGTQVAKTFHGTAGPGITLAIDSAGTQTQSGSVAGVSIGMFAASQLRDGTFNISEEKATSTGSGDGNGPGFLRLTTTTVPTTVDVNNQWWGFSMTPFSVPEWPQARVTHQDLMRTRIKFRARLPAGKSLTVQPEPEGYGYNERCELGQITGTGNWETYERTLGQGGNSTAFLNAINANSLGNKLKLSLVSAANLTSYTSGDNFDLDNFEIRYEGYSTAENDNIHNYEDAQNAVRIHRRLPANAGNTTSGNTTISSMTSTIGLQAGMGISGAGIPSGATITGILSSTSITISSAATATSTSPVNLFITYTNFRASVTSGSNVMTGFNNMSGIEVGMLIHHSSGNGTVPYGTKVASIDTAALSLTMTNNATANGTNNIITFGPERTFSYMASDNPAAGLILTVKEDFTPGAGNKSSSGHLKVQNHATSPTGGWTNVAIDRLVFRNLKEGAVTESDLDFITIDFAAKIPAGMTWSMRLDPSNGGYSERLDLPSITGTGNWVEYSVPLNNLNNTRPTFVNRLNNGNGAGNPVGGRVSCTLVMSSNPQQGPGVILQMDDIRFSPWREYKINLAQLGDPSAFLNYINSNSLTTFLPAFTKASGAAIGGSSLSIDDFKIEYVGPPASSIAALVGGGSSSGPWKYFVGIKEPSGTVVDSLLVTNPFTAPAGKEEDYEDPQETRDWLELKNSGSTAYDLTGHTLTDNISQPAKWAFPAGTSIPANGYLIVMCDNRFEANGATASYLHTNFTLNKDGGTLALFNGAAQVDSISYPSGHTPHQSFGRSSTSTNIVFMDVASPGEANGGPETTARADAPAMRQTDLTTPLLGDFYDTPQTVALVTSTVGGDIRYTVDGTDPTPTSTQYTTPVAINFINDKTGTVLRARTFAAGMTPSKITTETYLIGQNSALKTLPAFLMTGDAGRTFYLPTGVMAINGGSYDVQNVWQPGDTESYNIPNLQDSPAERFVNYEYMHADTTTAGFNVGAGVRLSASPYSRPRAKYTSYASSPWPSIAEQKPSFNLFFRGVYGPGRLNYPVIPGYDVTRFDNLRLRAGKNDISNPHITDELHRRIFTAMGPHEGITGTWCTLYVNGVFKGYYNLTERVREPFYQEHYNSSSLWDVIYNGNAENGDRVAFDNLVYTNLAQNLTLPTNWAVVKSKMDIVNACDYYLMKIYAAMWDWPGNNWAMARERSTGSNSIWRFTDWDSEGGMNANGYNLKTVTYNTIGLELTNNSTEVGRIFNALRTSTEFRINMADRIQKHFFNNGVLDDRGSLNSNFWLKAKKDELKAIVSPIIQYVTNQSFNEAWFNTWTNETTGRRTYLFGPNATWFSDYGFWPATAAAMLNLPSGNVAGGSSLTMTAAAGTIYYTTDGSDPRLEGGGINPNALIYTGPLSLVNSSGFKVRVRNGTEWSPIIERNYVIDPVAPSSSNLVIAEFMYNPPSATLAEATAPNAITNGDDFEYVRLQNVGNAPVTMSTVNLANGITYSFAASGVAALEPGKSVLVVKSLTAFQKRYGTALPNGTLLAAGGFTGGISNGGETLELRDGTTILHTVTYSDGSSTTIPGGDFWPKAADGFGSSLMLVNPTSAPNHNLVASWTNSVGAGGRPFGQTLNTNWATWRDLSFNRTSDSASIKDEDDDPDGDGLTNLLEYALGTPPKLANSPALLPQSSIMNVSGQDYLALSCKVNAAAIDATMSVEVSSTLLSGGWTSGSGHTVAVGTPVTTNTGALTFQVRDASAMSSLPRHFIRMKVTKP